MKILELLYLGKEVPKPLGLFHILSIVIVILVSLLLCIFLKNINDKKFRKVCLIFWIIFLFIETYKQIFMASSEVVDGQIVWGYKWYLFPFQFCSSPFFVLPIIIFAKEKSTLRKMAIPFMMTFSLFGGLMSYVFPSGVFASRVLINVQTMLHHGMQIILGVYFMVYFRKSLSWKSFFKGTILLCIFILIALVLDEIGYYTFVPENQVFNMFFISRHYECTMPILGEIYKKVPYLLFIAIYVIGFYLVGAIVYFIEKLINRIIFKIKMI